MFGEIPIDAARGEPMRGRAVDIGQLRVPLPACGERSTASTTGGELPEHMAVYEDFHALLWRNDS